MFASYGSGGSSPVWVTVVASRLVGGFFGGIAGYVIVRGSVDARQLGAGTTSTSRLVVLFVPMVLSAFTIGVAICLLLPRLSSRRIGLGNAIMAAFAGAMVPLIATLALVSDAGAHATDAFFVAGAGFVSIAFAILGIAITTWMVGSSSHELESWRGRPVAENPPWSSIEAVDRDGAHIDDEQAEHGYWGAMEGDDAPIGALGEDADPRP
jgi:hypothetical protein